jgi:hypothetical protein
MQRAFTPQPAAHSVHAVYLTFSSPRDGTGVHDQFWLQMETSSATFHGTGVKGRAAAAPPAIVSRFRRDVFIVIPY